MVAYRTAPAIVKFVNECFYENSHAQTHENVRADNNYRVIGRLSTMSSRISRYLRVMVPSTGTSMLSRFLFFYHPTLLLLMNSFLYIYIFQRGTDGAIYLWSTTPTLT